MSGSADPTLSIRAVNNDRTLKLDQLKAGQVVNITGDSGEFTFHVIDQEDSGPVGILYNSDRDMKVVQLVGMLPFSHEAQSKSGVATLRAGELIAEYGVMLAIETQNEQALFATFTFCCSTFIVEGE